MAVRFDAATDTYTGASISTSAWSISTWLYLTSDRNTQIVALSVEDGSTSGIYVGTDADGTTLRLFDWTTNIGGTALTVAAWYWVGVVANGTSLSFSVAPAGGAVTTASGTMAPSSPSVPFRLGGDAFASKWMDGRLAAVKVWTTNLAQAALENERYTYQPAYTASLLAWHPFLVAETTDYSGGGNSLTAGGTATATEDGPPIPWRLPDASRPPARSRAALY